MLRDEKVKHFQEVHNPHEDLDFGMRGEPLTRHHDEHEYYRWHLGHPLYDGHYSNGMKPRAPSQNSEEKNMASMDNVLEDDDPAICFVKAYARKPLGAPKKNVVPANGIDWYENGEDWYDDDYAYDNYGDFERINCDFDFSASDGKFTHFSLLLEL